MSRLVSCWRIEKVCIDEADVAWLTGCCNRLQVKNDDRTFNNLINVNTGSPITISGSGQEILVETTSEEQESMLKLKYEGSLTLISVMHYDDRDIQQRIDYFTND